MISTLESNKIIKSVFSSNGSNTTFSNGSIVQSVVFARYTPIILIQGETTHVGTTPANPEEAHYTARNVELWHCPTCNRHERFPRYNDPVKLLSTRRGRCGEFANVCPCSC